MPGVRNDDSWDQTGSIDMTKVMFALVGAGTLALALLAWIAR